MPEQIFINQFKSGWCPSDDAVNGRTDALLQMDNLELDKNGALSLAWGTQVLYGPFTGVVHSMFSKYLNNARWDFQADTSGRVYINAAVQTTIGDTVIAAFGVAFNYVLICSGNYRVKYNGTIIQNLGLTPPSVAPIIGTASPCAVLLGNPSGIVAPSGFGTVSVTNVGQYQMIAGTGSSTIISQTFPANVTLNTTHLVGPPGTGNSTPEDYIAIFIGSQGPIGTSFEFDVLLDIPDAAGDQVADYFAYYITDLSQVIGPLGGTIYMPRSAFVQVGSGGKGWNTVFGWRITLNMPFVSSGFTFQITAQPASTNGFQFVGGSLAQFGDDIQYAAVNVNNTGTYLAKSPLSASTPIVPTNGFCNQITLQSPIDAQTNEVWLFRRGGDLGGTWYRVARITSNFTTPFFDTFSDQAALDLNITFNQNLVSIASGTITDKIQSIIGPVNGRWFYFTQNFAYPSDINDPDLVDPSIAVRICNQNTEVFMWALPVSSTIMMIGTSIDCYILTGTFTTFPDNSVDVFYQKVNTPFPPITQQAASYGGAIYYLANDGWRVITATSFGVTYASSNNQLLVSPNTDRLYRNEASFGYPGVNLSFIPGLFNYPVLAFQNKLFCFLGNGAGRHEVFDFQRSYWRNVAYGLGDVSSVCATQDGRILAAYKNDRIVRNIGTPNTSTKLVDGVTQPNIKFMFTYRDNGKPRQRKDFYTFRFRGYTSFSSGLGVNYVVTDENNVNTGLGFSPFNSSTSIEQMLDISPSFSGNGTPYLPKSLLLFGSGQVTDFLLEDISLDFDSHAIPQSFIRIQPTNFGNPAPKRVRTVPFVLDTQVANAAITAYVDNVALPTQIVGSVNARKTYYYYFNTDVFGTDYAFTISEPSGFLEFYGMMDPLIVEAQPVPRVFDQVGPLEIFRLGKLTKIELYANVGDTTLPYNIFFDGSSVWQDTFQTIPGTLTSYFLDVPKGVNGRSMRVELGPSSIIFYRYYMRFWFAPSGNQDQTELQIITIPGGTLG